MDFHFKNITKPTPDKIKHFFDALMAACWAILGISMLANYVVFGLIMLIIFGIAKFFSCWLAEKNNNDSSISNQ